MLQVLDRRFIFRGSHSTISACTLPNWLTKEVIDYMAENFGNRLKMDLAGIVKREVLMQGRAKTPQSDTLSMDSNDALTGYTYISD